MKGSWDSLKTTFLWILVLILSLHTYGMFLDRQHQKAARDRWIEKGSEIAVGIFYLVTLPENKDKDKEEIRDLVQNALDNIYLVRYDSDFSALTDEERESFYYSVFHISEQLRQSS